MDHKNPPQGRLWGVYPNEKIEAGSLIACIEPPGRLRPADDKLTKCGDFANRQAPPGLLRSTGLRVILIRLRLRSTCLGLRITTTSTG